MKPIVLCLICYGSLFLGKTAIAEELKMTPETELISTLKDFATKHSLTQSDLLKMLGKFVLEGKQWKKGGIGVIDKNTFIYLDTQRNILKVSGQIWKGKASNKQEVVLTDGHSVLDSLDGVDLSKIIIVMFSPLEVRYIDLSSASGGKYMREIDWSVPAEE